MVVRLSESQLIIAVSTSTDGVEDVASTASASAAWLAEVGCVVAPTAVESGEAVWNGEGEASTLTVPDMFNRWFAVVFDVDGLGDKLRMIGWKRRMSVSRDACVEQMPL